MEDAVPMMRLTETDAEKPAIERLERLGRHGADDAARQYILEIAEATASPKIRNAAALAMADLRVDGAGGVLLRLLRREDTREHRGTLLYALEELGEKAPLPLLVSILLEDGYEAREQALDLLGKEQISFTPQELEAALAALKPLAVSDDEHAAVAGRTASRWLRSLKRRLDKSRQAPPRRRA